MKIPIPTPAELQSAAGPDLEKNLMDLLARIGTKGTYAKMIDGRRHIYSVIDVEIEHITATAEPIFRLLGVKPEFLPEVTPEPYFGRVGY